MRHHRTFLTFALAAAALLFSASGARATVPLLEKTGKIFFADDSHVCEVTPFLWEGKMLLLSSVHHHEAEAVEEKLWLEITDPASGETLARFGAGCSFACALVEGDTLHVFASLGGYWQGDIVHLKTTDLQNWTQTPAVSRDNEMLLNSSVCRDGDGYIMAYESNKPVGFCFKFARSADLEHWEKVPDTCYAGLDGKTYSACPVIRRFGDYYYVIYLREDGHIAEDGRNGYESAMIRSKDLRSWELAPVNPIFTAREGEGINNSDIDLCEVDGKTIFCYTIGNQLGWEDVREAVFDGTAEEFFTRCYPGPTGFGDNPFTGDEKVRKNIYVSRLGDDSDGKSWKTAFHSIQKALDAVPDAAGGYRVVIRPDTYFEANLLPKFSGAKGQYNELVGDTDGRFGSGASGWVVLDCSDPEKGFKSYDWYGPMRAYQKGWSAEHTGETVSSHLWDRWIIRRMYVSGGDAGFFWDCLDDPEPFTILVEDCVSIGRAFGIGVAFGYNVEGDQGTTRDEEPIVFRRTWAATLDTWGDAGALFFRSTHKQLAKRPEIYLEDCTLVSADNAVENNVGEYNGSTHVALKNCRLLVMNFTQPAGDPPCTGIIRTANDGSRYQIDLEDCLLMGCKVFSDEAPTPPRYTLKGKNCAYVQFNNPVPEGMIPMKGWPVDLFRYMAPPETPEGLNTASQR
ncbi:MAG: hypothetical protein IJH68_13695 [Thermoguttaceae bacterium]|nr:hypothetical protein [Thermoguttaceae bacterium]